MLVVKLLWLMQCYELIHGRVFETWIHFPRLPGKELFFSYSQHSKAKSWNDALSLCAANNAFLAHIESTAFQKAVAEYLTDYSEANKSKILQDMFRLRESF